MKFSFAPESIKADVFCWPHSQLMEMGKQVRLLELIRIMPTCAFPLPSERCLFTGHLAIK